MPSSNLFLLSSAAATATFYANTKFVDAFPSFGAKIPNGEVVPCPPDLAGQASSGCTASGYCLGLGHPNCGGFQSEDKVEGNTLLSPFGEDLRLSGFVWTKELCELDSDQDGYTNGEELGDPCCVWTEGGSANDVALNSVEGFVPSHPGMKDHIPPAGFAFDKASFCANLDKQGEENDSANANDDENAYDQYYNPDETRGSFEMRIKPYPIPVKETTYVDFAFNLPEDLPDLFHVVFGEPIISQPDHLHHFVIEGCTSPIDPSIEGMPLETPPTHCKEMGQLGGWAPSANMFGNDSLDTGILLGSAMNIKALLINVHYTDGVYENPETLTQKMATDGIRVHYTTNLRPYTNANKELINVFAGPTEMVVPSNESRYFLSRTCNVDTKCKDMDDEQLQGILESIGASNNDGEVSCGNMREFCFADGQLGATVQYVCPVTCGLCDGEKNPHNPDAYRVTAVAYHAHLLGREMYTTLLREQQNDDDNNVATISKRSSTSTNAPMMVTKDLKSRDFWTYDDQSAIPMDNDIVSPSDPSTMIRGVEVKPGDKIQATCVYDSTDRADDTVFGQSTYDEMCIVTLIVRFKTPRALLENSVGATSNDVNDATVDLLNIYTDIQLHTFSCEVDNENHTTDVYQGFLTETEDARDIWSDHPIEESDMCTFPVMNLGFEDHRLTWEVRNCQGGDTQFDGTAICDGLSSSDDANVEFLGDAIAGYTCVGGTYDMKSSHEDVNLTEELCLENGGSMYVSYTCSDAENWFLNDAKVSQELTDELVEYMRTEWYRPVCCLQQSEGEGESETIPSDINADESALSSAAFTQGNTLAFLTATAAIMAMVL